MTSHWTDELVVMHACPEAIAWARDYPSLQSAWGACERGDWMLWYLGRCDVDRRRLVLAACACARTALPHVPAGEDRPRIAIETAERWAHGDETVTFSDVRSAASASADAATDADAASTYAADAAYAATYAAVSAADTASATYAARAAGFTECARIVRTHFPRVGLPSEPPR